MGEFLSELISNIMFLFADGIIWGFVIALIALGLSLIFGIMGIINMAHGDMYMIGAVLALVFSGLFGNFWIALIIVPVIVGIASMPLERWVLRPYEGKPLITMVATIGVSFIIQQITLMVFGGEPHMVYEPIKFTVPLFGVPYSGYRVFAAGIGLVSIAILWLALQRTKLGVYIRATMEQPEMADAIGINTSFIRAITFGIGVGLAAFGGALAAPINKVFYLMGLDVMLFSFIVVIIGGLGNLAGTLIAALVLSGFEGLLSAFLEPITARVVILLLMALVVVWKPKGLFSS